MVQRVGHYLSYLVVRVVICVAQAVPLEACHQAARLLAILFADVLHIREATILDNLRHALPELSEARRRRVARKMWEHLFLFAAETAQTPRKIHETNWREFLDLHKQDVLVRLLLSDRPLIMVSGHFGSFELAGYVQALFGYTTYAVARELDNPFLDEFVYRSRCVKGQHILSKKGDYQRIGQVLAESGTMSFLADQYAGSKGCWVNFFGRPVSAHKAIALFALDSDAPLAVGYCRRAGAPLRYEMALTGVADPRSAAEEVASVRALTQWYTSHLEQSIRQTPEQYWWLHKRWKDNRAARRRGVKKAA